MPPNSKRRRRVAVPKSIAPPRYVASRPQYAAFRAFNIYCGSHDTLLNLMEVALRAFEKEMAKSPDERVFVNSACVTHGINSTLGVPWHEVRKNSSRLAIMQLLSVIDDFVEELSEEYRQFANIPSDKWKTHRDEKRLDPLSQLLENLPKSVGKRVRAYPEHDLIQYYRAVRNKFVHITSKDIDRMWQGLINDYGSEWHLNRCK